MVVNTWLKNPYWQFFTGETYLQTELPIDPSSLTRWRQDIGEEGVELLLAITISAARAAARRDALHAVLCGAGHNIRLPLSLLRLLFRADYRAESV